MSHVFVDDEEILQDVLDMHSVDPHWKHKLKNILLSLDVIINYKKLLLILLSLQDVLFSSFHHYVICQTINVSSHLIFAK